MSVRKQVSVSLEAWRCLSTLKTETGKPAHKHVTAALVVYLAANPDLAAKAPSPKEKP